MRAQGYKDELSLSKCEREQVQAIALFPGRTRGDPGALIALQAPGSSQISGVLSTLQRWQRWPVLTHHPPPGKWGLAGQARLPPFGPSSVGLSDDAGASGRWRGRLLQEVNDSHLRAGDERAAGAWR